MGGWTRRKVEASAEAHAEIVDNETVFYVDIFGPDGYYNYDVWAEELGPWLERFVD